MPAPTTIREFVELGVRSGLLEADLANSLPDRPRDAVGDESSESALASFVETLIESGRLTRFQADKLRHGRWRGFDISGKYRLLERLGAGGMGAVYLCEHLTMGRRVALKVLPLALASDPASLQRFYREARAVARLDHPHLIRAFDLDHEENLHFLVLEFVDGCNLHDFVRRNGPLSPARTAHYLRQAALGLAHAHEAGLVHRDIKPSNMLLDRTGCVKLLDMGLARFFDEENSAFVKEFEQGYVIGTADYLAPEQAVDSQVDIRADIYSLGCTAYFLLTGRSPFQEGNSHQKMLWHQVRMPKPISKHRSDVPAGLLAVIEQMMAKEPIRRQQSPGELADALLEFTMDAIAPPAVREMPPVVLAAASRPGSQANLATEQIGENAITTPGPRRIRPAQRPSS